MNTTTKTLFSVFTGFDAGTSTKTLRKFATEPVCNLSGEYVQPDTVEKMTNKKAVMRLAQALNFIQTGDVSAFDKVIGCTVLLLMLNEPGKGAGFADVHFALSGAGKDHAKHLPGIGSAALRKTIGKVAPSTVTSQTSRTVGKNGLLTALGATTRDAHGFTVADKSHPFIVAYARRLSMMPEGTLLEALKLDPLDTATE